jgi:phage terminase small subunit
MGKKKLPPEEMEILPQQAIFIEEYLASRNGAQSAIKAGYSIATAKQIAHNLLVSPHIKLALENRLEELRLEYHTRIQRARDEIYKLAVEAPPQKVTDQLRALELFGKMHGMLTDRVEHTGLNGGPIQTIAADATPEKAIEVYATLLN